MKTWVTPGGVHPPENKHQSLTLPIGSLPLPEKLLITLSQHIGTPAKPCVELGSSVLKGQKIAEAAGPVSVPMHAPTSGTISAIEHRPIAHSSGMLAPCIEITSDGRDQWQAHQGIEDYKNASASTLLQAIAEAGIAGMGGAGFPSAVKLNPGSERPIHTLIVNATECEPYITADDSAIRERAAEIIEGIGILSQILGHPDNILIGIEDNKPEAIAALEPHTQDSGVSVVSFPTKYPSGGEKQLIYILTGQEIPSGGLPADIGMVCVNIGTTYAIKRAIVEGEPLISRVTTMTGEACGINRNYETLIGTMVSHMLEHSQFNQDRCSRLVMGGPMMGFSLTSAEVPIVKTTNCILAPSYDEIPDDEPAQPCIRCGLCEQSCPVSLLPQQMLWAAKNRQLDAAQLHSLDACIECGACAYVCPSRIPLVQYFRYAKGEIRQENEATRNAERARIRFENRQNRLERELAEKEAKRQLRAATAAKALAAKTGAEGQAGSETNELIAATLERVAAKKPLVGAAPASPSLEELAAAAQASQAKFASAAARLAEAEVNAPDMVNALQRATGKLEEKYLSTEAAYQTARAAADTQP